MSVGGGEEEVRGARLGGQEIATESDGNPLDGGDEGGKRGGGAGGRRWRDWDCRDELERA